MKPLAFLLPLLGAAPALAEPQAYRLSQAEIDATIAAASHRAETSSLLPQVMAPPLSLPNLPPAGDLPMLEDRKPHGVAGFAVSSDGGFALFGSTAVPIGQDSFASFSFSYSRIPTYGFGYGYGYAPYSQQLLPPAMPRR
jgi:hypothetical protein